MSITDNVTIEAETEKKEPSVTSTQQITPFLWFDGKVEEAVNFYTSVFKNSKVVNISRLPGEVPGRDG